MDEKTFSSSIPYSGQTFEVHYAAWRTTIAIVDPATSQRLYVLHAEKGCRGRYEIVNAEGQSLGTAKTSSMTSKIEVNMHTTYGEQLEFDIKNDKVLGMGSPRYESPAFGGQTMTWKNTAMSKDIIYTLIEGKGMALARFQSDRHTMVGKLEIVDPSMDDAKMREVMVVLLTLVRRKLRQIQDAVTAAIVS